LDLDILVGEADSKSVLVGLVLVLVLGDQLVSLSVISASLYTKLGLERSMIGRMGQSMTYHGDV
jgi:hypothetical protein